MQEMYPMGPFVLLKLHKPEEAKIIVSGGQKADVRTECEVLRVGPDVKHIKVGDIAICPGHIFNSKFRDGDYYFVEEKLVVAVARENAKEKNFIEGITVGIKPVLNGKLK